MNALPLPLTAAPASSAGSAPPAAGVSVSASAGAVADAPSALDALLDGHSDTGQSEGSLLSFGDLLKLKPVMADATADESEETLPTAADLSSLLPLLGVPMGAPMGLAMPPPVDAQVPAAAPVQDPAAPIIGAIALAAATKPAAADVATAIDAADSGDAIEPQDATMNFRAALAELAIGLFPDPALSAADLPPSHAHLVAELALPLPKARDDGAAMAASGFAPAPGTGPASAPANAQPASPPPVTVPPSHPDWSREIAASVAWSVKNESTDVEIKLHPPELGALRVLLKIDGHRVEANFSAPLAETRQALEQTLPRLRELLEGQGLSLMQAQVSDQHRHAAQGTPFMPSYGEPSAEPEFTAPVVVRIRTPGLLDEYA